ncbi:unnamed protein product [Lymnaea stagnalis]|uniref:Uncharacterized protein n=1 Tax=Lymnaea stagnalis TaxID=6523 RepID=A0AAV2IJX3_LYMST
MTFSSSNMYQDIDIDLHTRGPRGRSVVTSLSEACRITADVIEMYEKLASEHKKAMDELELYRSFQMRGTGPYNENEPVGPQVANRAIMDLNDRITALNLKITDTEFEKRRLQQEIESLNGTIVGLEQEMEKMNGTMEELSKSRNEEQENVQQQQNENEEEKKFIDLRKKYIEVNIKARDLENQKKLEEAKQSIAEMLKRKKDEENRIRISNVINSEVTATQRIGRFEVRQDASSTRVGGPTSNFTPVIMLHSEFASNKSHYFTWCPSNTSLHKRT